MTDLTEVKTIGTSQVLYSYIYKYIVIHTRSLLQLSHLFPPYHSNAKENPLFLLEQQPLLQHHQFKHPLKKTKEKKNNNMSSTDAPAGDVQDNSYVNRPGQNEYNVPVVKDDTAAAATEEGGYTDESTADSDAQLGIFHLSLPFSLSFFLSLSHTTSPTHQPSFFFFSPFSIHLSLTHTHSLTPLSLQQQKTISTSTKPTFSNRELVEQQRIKDPIPSREMKRGCLGLMRMGRVGDDNSSRLEWRWL